MTREFPEATHLSRSWVVTSPDGIESREFFSRAKAKAAFDAGYDVVLIGDHLASLNKNIEEAK